MRSNQLTQEDLDEIDKAAVSMREDVEVDSSERANSDSEKYWTDFSVSKMRGTKSVDTPDKRIESIKDTRQRISDKFGVSNLSKDKHQFVGESMAEKPTREEDELGPAKSPTVLPSNENGSHALQQLNRASAMGAGYSGPSDDLLAGQHPLEYMSKEEAADDARISRENAYNEMPESFREDLKSGNVSFEGAGASDRLKASFAEGSNEIQKQLMKKYPKGDFKEISGVDSRVDGIYFTKNAESEKPKWVKFDPDFFNENSSLKELGKDILDFAKPIVLGAGETLAALATGFKTGPLSFLTRGPNRRAALTAAGLVAGEEAIETMAGIQEDDLSTVLSNAGSEALWSLGTGVAADTAVSLMSKKLNITPDNPLFQRVSEFVENNQDKLQYSESPYLFQAIDNPVWFRWVSQSSYLSDVLPKALYKQSKSLFSEMENFITNNNPLPENFLPKMNGYLENYKQHAMRNLPDASKDFYKSSQEFTDFMNSWSKQSQTYVSALYKDALDEQAGLSFPVGSLRDTAREILQTGQKRRVDELGNVTSSSSVELPPKLTNLLSHIDETTTAFMEKRLLDPLDADELIRMRSAAGELSKPSLGEPYGYSHKLAKELHDELTHALESAEGFNSEAAKVKWKEANKQARTRFEFLNTGAVQQTLQAHSKEVVNTTPEKVIEGLMNSSLLSNRQELVRMDEYYKKLVQEDPIAAKQLGKNFDLMSIVDDLTVQDMVQSVDTGTFTSRLQKMKEGEFERLVPDPVMRKNLVLANDTLRELNEIKVGGQPLLKSFQNKYQVDEKLGEMFFTSKSAGRALQDVVKHSPAMAKEVEATLMNSLFNRSKSMSDSRVDFLIDSPKLAEDIQALKDNNMYGFISKDNQKFLDFVLDYSALIKQASDSGTNLQAASVAAGLARMELSAVLTAAKYRTFGKFVTSDAGREWAKKAIRNPSDVKNGLVNKSDFDKSNSMLIKSLAQFSQNILREAETQQSMNMLSEQEYKGDSVLTKKELERFKESMPDSIKLREALEKYSIYTPEVDNYD